ncbi:hypothetical protein [Myxosarcina sp. GI1]|uniref:hypothetical protein n=1 Tax=Myxosarcina sp. GI1 TaxID=1541065 RepID=UPI00056AFC7F|nr:hypothetical protein [Myxosarcina sp. GI1]
MPDNIGGAIALVLNCYDLGLNFASALHLAMMQKYKTFYTFDKASIKSVTAIELIKVNAPKNIKLR